MNTEEKMNVLMPGELADSDLEQVSGGFVSGGTIASMMLILKKMEIDADEDDVKDMIHRGGSVLRDYAKQHAAEGKKGMANLIPIF